MRTGKVSFLRKINLEKSSPGCLRKVHNIRAQLLVSYNSVFLGMLTYFRVPTHCLSSGHCINISKKKEKRTACSLSLNCVQPFYLCHIGQNLVALSILGWGGDEMWALFWGLCALGKIRSSVTLEEGKNVFGGPLAGSLIVNLNLRRWNYAHIKF